MTCFAPSAPVRTSEDRLDRLLFSQGHHRPFRVASAPRPEQIALADGLVMVLARGATSVTAPGPPFVSLTFARSQGNETVSIGNSRGEPGASRGELVVLATPSVCEQTFGFGPNVGAWHLSSSLRFITATIAACARTGAARNLYLRAKGLELACETFEQLRMSALTPSGECDKLSEADTRRLIAARAMIEERSHEPLTLEGIARACGLNRSSLSRGFRVLFGTTVATLVGETRMQRAKHLLLTTDLRIGTVGFRSGYRNNASFARAFIRHHGVSPLAVRATSGR